MIQPLELVLLFPLSAALLLSLVPRDDSRTRHSLGVLFQVAWFITLLYLYKTRTINLEEFILLATQSAALIWIRFKKNDYLLQTITWLIMSLSAASILAISFQLALLFAFCQVLLLLFAILQTGGLYKGRTAYESILFFLSIDLAAFFAVMLNYEWLYWILILPGLARILFPLASPHAKNIFFNCPTEVMILFLATTVPVGLSLLTHAPLPPYPEILGTIAAASALFAAVVFLMEKSRRQRSVVLFMIQSSLSAALILNAQIFGLWLCLIALLNSILWLYLLEWPRVRIFNILTATIIIFCLAYLS
ncbi:MAG: hypothetical protein JKY15_01135 [Deltaproteobacteria bacterium]|nr:hypothetical protein [Deltaproteobacteria bacterium]